MNRHRFTAIYRLGLLGLRGGCCSRTVAPRPPSKIPAKVAESSLMQSTMHIPTKGRDSPGYLEAQQQSP